MNKKTKRGGREKRKNQKDKMIWRERKRKKWIWKMLQDTFKENGNGSKMWEELCLKSERRERKERRRRSDKIII